MIAWVDDVRPDLPAPYGTFDGRRMHRKTVKSAMASNLRAGQVKSIEVIDTPSWYTNTPIQPPPLYWVRISTFDTSGEYNPSDEFAVGDITIEIPVVKWQGAHHFYGSPFYKIGNSVDFGNAAEEYEVAGGYEADYSDEEYDEPVEE